MVHAPNTCQGPCPSAPRLFCKARARRFAVRRVQLPWCEPVRQQGAGGRGKPWGESPAMADTSVGKGVDSDENVPLKPRVPGLRCLFQALLPLPEPKELPLACMSNFSSSCVSILHVLLEHGYKDVWKFGRSHKDVLLRCPVRDSRNVNYRHSGLLLTLLHALRYIDHADIVTEVRYKKW